MLKTIFYISLALLLALDAQSSYNSEIQKIDKMLASWHSENKAGLSVAVNKGNQTIYQNYYGLADLEHGTPINRKTKFLIASVSKQFTAFAITLLADENKLNLQNDVRTYIPELPTYKEPITIMHLLNHTSGLRDIDDLNGIIGAGLSDYVSFNDVFKLIIQQKELNFKPGTQFDYSNSGYVLLAKIVENISGMSFREFMFKSVFKPLGMNNTLVSDNPFEVIVNKATAYYSNDGIKHSKNNLFSSVYGSTGMYTTLKDLNLWAKNFVTHKVGNQNIFNQMKKQGKLENGTEISYALGQEIKIHKGHQAIFHGGGQGAYRAYLVRFPDSELSVTLISNSSYSTSFLLKYAYDIADLFLEAKQTNKPQTNTEIQLNEFEPIEVELQTLKKYVGNFQIQPGLFFNLKINNKALELLISGSTKVIPLVAISNNKFMLNDSDNGYHIIFSNDGDNQSQSLQYYQYDMEYLGSRVDLIEFDQENIQWHELTGLYYSEELNTVYSLKYDSKKLTAHHARNLPITLTPHQPNVFYGAATFFQEIKFTRDVNKKVVFMLVSGSRSKDIKFRKM